MRTLNLDPLNHNLFNFDFFKLCTCLTFTLFSIVLDLWFIFIWTLFAFSTLCTPTLIIFFTLCTLTLTKRGLQMKITKFSIFQCLELFIDRIITPFIFNSPLKPKGICIIFFLSGISRRFFICRTNMTSSDEDRLSSFTSSGSWKWSKVYAWAGSWITHSSSYKLKWVKYCSCTLSSPSIWKFMINWSLLGVSGKCEGIHSGKWRSTYRFVGVRI